MEDSQLKTFIPMHVLVVDDDPTTVFVISEHLKHSGFSVETASDGQLALAQMEQRLPDLVICDRLMPNLSGVDVLENIRQRGPEWQSVAFVFLTGLTDRRDRYAMMPLHPDGYLTKPVDFVKFDNSLSAALTARKKRLMEQENPCADSSMQMNT